jgi:hypothetical protein
MSLPNLKLLPVQCGERDRPSPRRHLPLSRTPGILMMNVTCPHTGQSAVPDLSSPTVPCAVRSVAAEADRTDSSWSGNGDPGIDPEAATRRGIMPFDDGRAAGHDEPADDVGTDDDYGRTHDALGVTDRSGPPVSSLIGAAVCLDVDTVIDTVATSIADHGVVWTWERLIRPVWTELASGRDDTDLPVAAQRLFSRAVSQVMATDRRSRDRAPARVLLACADEEHHTLPLDALAAALAEFGASSCVLGARVPPNAMAAAVRRLRPAVVVIWSQTGDTADPQQITSLLKVRPTPELITAGPGWDIAALPAQAATSTTVVAALKLTQALLGAARSSA